MVTLDNTQQGSMKNERIPEQLVNDISFALHNLEDRLGLTAVRREFVRRSPQQGMSPSH